eukprot:snap_masked-scaffold_16-processed-gene-0.19-mRNA-1 protein AED:0.53 eAED:0.53 QI:0/-1/0/1/-1/1/1/0/307
MDKCRSLASGAQVTCKEWSIKRDDKEHVYVLKEGEGEEMKVWMQPSQSLLFEADIASTKLNLKGFDMVYADPPWDVGVANNPTRGMTLHLPTMKDEQILKIPLGSIMPKGLAEIWVPNNKLGVDMKWLIAEGFAVKEYIVWIKKTSSGKTFQSQGGILMHSKELLVIGVKGQNVGLRTQMGNDVFEGAVREPFRKPDGIYNLLEKIYPDARKIELFARHWNVKENWTSVGNEVKGTAALKEGSVIQEPGRITSSFPRTYKPKPKSWPFSVYERNKDDSSKGSRRNSIGRRVKIRHSGGGIQNYGNRI